VCAKGPVFSLFSSITCQSQYRKILPGDVNLLDNQADANLRRKDYEQYTPPSSPSKPSHAVRVHPGQTAHRVLLYSNLDVVFFRLRIVTGIENWSWIYFRYVSAILPLNYVWATQGQPSSSQSCPPPITRCWRLTKVNKLINNKQTYSYHQDNLIDFVICGNLVSSALCWLGKSTGIDAVFFLTVSIWISFHLTNLDGGLSGMSYVAIFII